MHRFPVRHQQFLHKLVFLMNHQSQEKINLKTLSEPHGSWIYYVIIIFILFLIPCANKTWSAHDNLFWHICCNYTITTGLSNSHAMFKGFFTYSHVSFYTEEDSPQYGTQTSESPEEFWRNTYCWAPTQEPRWARTSALPTSFQVFDASTPGTTFGNHWVLYIQRTKDNRQHPTDVNLQNTTNIKKIRKITNEIMAANLNCIKLLNGG